MDTAALRMRRYRARRSIRARIEKAILAGVSELELISFVRLAASRGNDRALRDDITLDLFERNADRRYGECAEVGS